jgi:hypothetical protein
MTKQITTTKQVLVKQLEQNTSIESKAKVAFTECKKQGFTHNKAGREITEVGLARLMKAMVRDIKTAKKGWWSSYDIKLGKTDEIQIVKKKVIN